MTNGNPATSDPVFFVNKKPHHPFAVLALLFAANLALGQEDTQSWVR